MIIDIWWKKNEELVIQDQDLVRSFFSSHIFIDSFFLQLFLNELKLMKFFWKISMYLLVFGCINMFDFMYALSPSSSLVISLIHSSLVNP